MGKQDVEDLLIDKAAEYALDWLNAFGSISGERLEDDYFVSRRLIMHKDGNDEVMMFGDHLILLELNPADDGGSAMMFAHMTDEGKVLWGAWYFDTEWGEMKWPAS